MLPSLKKARFTHRLPSLAGLGLGLFLAVAATPSFAKLYDKAQAYYEGHEYQSAVIELKNLLQDEADNAAARALLGKVYLELGNAAAAEKELLKAIELGLEGDEMRILVARARLMQGNVEAVIADIVPEEFKSDENRAEAYALQGQAYLGKQQIADDASQENRMM